MSSHGGYQTAQRAVADLKWAVLETLNAASSDGLSNAEIGRSLGIYAGHKGHEGHVSRTMLALLEAEGVVEQDASTKRWRPRVRVDAE